MNLEVVQTSGIPGFRQPRPVAAQELGLWKATDGMFTARRVKAQSKWSIEDIASKRDAWFSFLYILSGSVTLKLQDREVTLGRHDAVTQAPLSADIVASVSDQFEFFEVQAPRDARVLKFLPNVPKQIVSLDCPEVHIVGKGPRSFFDYRDLGVADSTDRRIEIQVVRAQRSREGGTGWHTHTMAQLTYGLSGWALLGVQGCNDWVRQECGDALCIPAGYIHNAGSFSDDYWAMQVQIPADYDTIPSQPLPQLQTVN
jgi:hypothetical protein